MRKQLNIDDFDRLEAMNKDGRYYGRMSEAVAELSSEAVGLASDVVRYGVRDISDGHKQTWKAARNARILTPVSRISIMAPVAAFIVSACLTMCHASAMIQASSYSIAIALAIIFDALELVSRVLAPQARGLISTDLILFAICLISKSQQLAKVTFIFVLASLALLYFLNDTWLSSYNWIMSENVRQAIIQDDDAEAVGNWNEHGKREARTMLSECGLEFDNGTLDRYGKPLFVLGYYTGHKNTVKAAHRADKAEANYRRIERELSDIARERDEAIRKYKKLEEDTERELESLRGAEEALQMSRLLYSEVKKENDALKTANEELIEKIPESEEIAAQAHRAEESQEEQITRMLQANVYSIRQIADACGCSKYQVEKIKKLLKSEVPEASDNVISVKFG